MRKADGLLLFCMMAALGGCGAETQSNHGGAGTGGIAGSGGEAGEGGSGGAGGAAGQGGGGGEAATNCGDGIAAGDEDCDGEDLQGASCASLDLGSGTLHCSESCSYDTLGCAAAHACGNGIREGSEACDGDDFGSDSCEARAFARGSLSCTERCEVSAESCELPIDFESEPNDDPEHAGSLSVPSVAHGTVLNDDSDYWAIQIRNGARYHLWTTLDLAGGCEDSSQDSDFSYANSTGRYSIDVDLDDIDRTHHCSSAVITANTDGEAVISVFAWSPRLEYYLWVEEL